ncbi:hypothetical protein C5167_038383 [Papaver somniferum]|uniref:AAA+ ATPase domain-containing protein n=1 Tax=Papaver somniferum TaxID=3469 RepID=A0A4Y7I9C0_PAPSO|nr:hypothetical protein C5167_038383 [Papaver somniferum]
MKHDLANVVLWEYYVSKISVAMNLYSKGNYVLILKDFKLSYDAKFGRKKEPVKKDDEHNQITNAPNGYENSSMNGNGHAQNTSDLAIYEQYRLQGQRNLSNTNGIANGGISDKPKKSLFPPFESVEMRNLAESLSRDIIRGNPDVKWESIKGLENAKRLLKEAVVMPIKYPKYFTGLLSPWKGILLFGPPGTGKTMLAKAVATECGTTFFNISASSIVSKWRGDSEKLVKVLFELARHHAPSTIFLDEIDAIISQRGEGRSEHEASRRLKTELLVQILVPLPEPEARKAMFEELLPAVCEAEDLPYDLLIEKTEGYSGSDIRLVCKEAAMQPLRRVMKELENKEEVVPEEELPVIGPIRPEDIETALINTRPSAHLHAPRYDKFNTDYGSQILQ